MIYIFDIDGTLSDASHCLHLIDRQREGGPAWENDGAFGSANAVVDRHNREIESAYIKGFEDARSGALICVNQWRDWDLRNQGKTAQAIGESINQMTADKHAEFTNKQRRA